MSADVLVVDDELSVRTTEAEILRAAGYEVVEAADGTEALAMLEAHEVGAVVLDVRMPRCDGLTVVASLEDPPPIVMVSAHTLGDADVARVAGKVAAFLAKPVPPAKLVEQVRLALRGGSA